MARFRAVQRVARSHHGMIGMPEIVPGIEWVRVFAVMESNKKCLGEVRTPRHWYTWLLFFACGLWAGRNSPSTAHFFLFGLFSQPPF